MSLTRRPSWGAPSYPWLVSEVIGQRELCSDIERIMRALDEGRCFVLTRDSIPVGELRPLRRQRLMDVSVVTELFRGAPRVDATRVQHDLDDAVDQTGDPQ